jgi:hypothetical protein
MAKGRSSGKGIAKVALIAAGVVLGFRYIENKTGKSPGK